MITEKLELWFPKPILVVDGLHTDRLPEYIKGVDKLTDKTGTIRAGGLQVNSTHRMKGGQLLHKMDEFKDLVDDINGYIARFLQSQSWELAQSHRVRIDGMWANRNVAGDYLWPHVHPGSIVSGAFYISALDPVSEIIFYRGLEYMFNEARGSIPPNTISYEFTTYKCHPARLLLFRSDFQHGCYEAEGTGEKIVISFNTKLFDE